MDKYMFYNQYGILLIKITDNCRFFMLTGYITGIMNKYFKDLILLLHFFHNNLD